MLDVIFKLFDLNVNININKGTDISQKTDKSKALLYLEKQIDKNKLPCAVDLIASVGCLYNICEAIKQPIQTIRLNYEREYYSNGETWCLRQLKW